MNSAEQEILNEIAACFNQCQGMTLYSTQESDRYWEMSEKLMDMYGRLVGIKVLRGEAAE